MRRSETCWRYGVVNLFIMLAQDPKEIRGKYMIRETGDQFFVQGLKEHIVTSQEEVESVISTGNGTLCKLCLFGA